MLLQVQDYEDTVTGDTKDIGVFTPNPGGFCVLTVTTKGEVALVTDMKFGIGEMTTWIGGGRVQDGDTKTGARHFIENLGFEPGAMIYLGEIPYIPGDCTGYQQYWLALDCVQTEAPPSNLSTVDLTQFYLDVENGMHRNPFTIIAAGLARKHLVDLLEDADGE